MTVLKTALSLADRREGQFAANLRAWKQANEALQADRAVVAQGGGPRAAERQHQKGRLTARERIALLQDPGTEFFELMMFAGYEMYAEAGGAPSGGVITGTVLMHGRPWMVIANDATVKAGAFFPITSKKVIRAQTIAQENRIPLVYLVDSAGVYLPMQDEIFPDQDDFGRVFYLNARISAQGIPQIASIMGNCVAGGAYLPAMCDTIIMTEGSGLYLAGPALVKAAIGQDVTSEDLGGATMHAEVAGTIDYHEPDDKSALRRIRALAEHYAPPAKAPWAHARIEPREPNVAAKELQGILPVDGGKQPYSTRELLARLVDGSEFEEYKETYGRSLVTGYARLGGYSVGIVANEKNVIRAGKKIEIGGVIYAEAADKAARFILNCNQAGVPLLFLHDVNGFMVGVDSERDGIIRRGAKLVNAVSNSIVPRISVILGGSYGAGHYALSGRAYAPRFLFSLPSGKFSVMGGEQAAKTIVDIQAAQRKRRGENIGDEELQALFDEVKKQYDKALDIRYAGARLWIDEIVTPEELRPRLIHALDIAAFDTGADDVKLGVFQV